MPKKKKGAKKGGKGKKTKKSASAKGDKAAAAAAENAGPTELELSLRLELQTLEAELEKAKAEAEDARKQNEWLTNEVNQTQDETQEYHEFMKKKTAREQARIQNLSDSNQKQIDAIEQQRNEKSAEYEQRKEKLREQILDAEGEIQRINRQIADLIEVQELRDGQEAEIADLEGAIAQLESDHAEEMQRLKAKYLQQKLEFQQEAQEVVQELEEQASQEAVVCLDEHTHRIKVENKTLRRELLQLIKGNKVLQQREEALVNQNKELKRQCELDMRVGEVRTASSSRASTSHSRTK